MSINRIDFQGAFLRTDDVGRMKAAEDNRPQIDQSAFQVQFSKEREQEQQSVQSSDEARQQNKKFDAREKGKNEYRQNKQKKEEEDEGGVVDMNGRVVSGTLRSSGFDLQV